MDLTRQLEAILFYKSEPVSPAALGKLLNATETDIENAAANLKSSLAERGVQLLVSPEGYTLATAPEAADLIERMIRDELSKDIGKAGLETLTIVLYCGQASRAEIDYIRGVNSSFILRHLLVRGLLDRKPNPEDARSFIYHPTAELLAHLGVSSTADLPEFEKIRTEIENFTQRTENPDPAIASTHSSD